MTQVRHGVIAKSTNLAIDTPHAVEMTDDYLNDLFDQVYSDWKAGGSKRVWNQSESHVLVLTGNAYEQVAKRLRALAKKRNQSVKIGRPLASEETKLFVPFLVLDKPEPKPKPEPVEVESFQLSSADWDVILQSLRFVASNATSDHTLAIVSNLATRIEANLHDLLSVVERRQIEGAI